MTHFGAQQTHTGTGAAHTQCAQTSLIKCACVQNTNVHAHTQMHAYASPHTHAHTKLCRCVCHCASLPQVQESEGEKNNHLKALIRIWTVTRLVHKLGEIWVGITIWQPAVRHQTSSVISIFSHDSELCDKQHHAASQSVSPYTGNVAN